LKCRKASLSEEKKIAEGDELVRNWTCCLAWGGVSAHFEKVTCRGIKEGQRKKLRKREKVLVLEAASGKDVQLA